MLSKSLLLATLLSLTTASPLALFDKRATGTLNFVNKTPGNITFSLVGPGAVISSGTVNAGVTRNFPFPTAGNGYSLKLSKAGQSGLLQLEYAYNSDNNVFFDWSAVNGPNPFTANVRSIVPAKPSAPSCNTISCAKGQDDTRCESTSMGQGPIGTCPVFNGVVLTATIST